MKIIITGVAGFIGSCLGEKLITEGYMVIGIDNFDPFYPRLQNFIDGIWKMIWTFISDVLYDTNSLNLTNLKA